MGAHVVNLPPSPRKIAPSFDPTATPGPCTTVTVPWHRTIKVVIVFSDNLFQQSFTITVASKTGYFFSGLPGQISAHKSLVLRRTFQWKTITARPLLWPLLCECRGARASAGTAKFCVTALQIRYCGACHRWGTTRVQIW